MKKARLLKPSAKKLFGEDVRSGREPIPTELLAAHSVDADYTVDTEPLVVIVEEAIRLYPVDPENANRKVRSECDSWMAPRVHAAFRLTRRQAADPNLWFYLATTPELSPYVFYRWGGGRTDAVPLERFAGALSNQALSRLWWMAELTRNGPDYKSTVKAMLLQDIPNTWLRLDAFHNRAFALASIDYINRAPESRRSKVINRIATVLNSALVTVSLDALAPTISTADSVAIEAWLHQRPDVDQMLVDLPLGPSDYPVSHDEIGAVTKLIEELCDPIIRATEDQDDGGESGEHEAQPALAGV